MSVTNNEGYMNTGIQRSSATPEGAWTTTTPAPYVKDTPKKDIIRIMAAHKIPTSQPPPSDIRLT